MSETRCPGQDQRYWRPEDICFAACPHCGVEIEFWKDEPVRVCRSCRQEVMNPKRDFGCAEWCRHASVCVGSKGSTRGAEGFKVPASAAASQPAERGGELTVDPSAATG